MSTVPIRSDSGLSDIVEFPGLSRFSVEVQRLERLVAIAETLRRAAPRPVSASRLADEFGVSVRTIERDLAALRAADVPLYGEMGRTGGSVSLDRLGDAIVTLSPAEVMALVSAVDAAGPSMPYADFGVSAVSRIIDALPPSARLTTELLRDRTRTLEASITPANRRVRRTIEAAVRRGVVVNIRYEDRHSTITDRSVDAVGFLRHTEGWYLIGWCHLRQAGRLFHLDRIRRAHLTRTPSDPHDVDETLGWVPPPVARP